MAFSDGRFIAVGEFGAVVTSDNGINWQFHQVDHKTSLYSVTLGQDKFVAVGVNWTTQTTAIRYSDDGISWTLSDVSIAL